MIFLSSVISLKYVKYSMLLMVDVIVVRPYVWPLNWPWSVKVIVMVVVSAGWQAHPTSGRGLGSIRSRTKGETADADDGSNNECGKAETAEGWQSCEGPSVQRQARCGRQLLLYLAVSGCHFLCLEFPADFHPGDQAENWRWHSSACLFRQTDRRFDM